MAAKARIPVEFYFDDELGTWHFQVSEPRVVGGGQKTIEKAEEAAARAIAFALKGAKMQARRGKIIYLEVAIGS